MKAVVTRKLVATGLVTAELRSQLVNTIVVAAVMNRRDIEESPASVTLEADLALDDIASVAGFVLTNSLKHSMPSLRKSPDLGGWWAVHVVVWNLFVKRAARPLRTGSPQYLLACSATREGR